MEVVGAQCLWSGDGPPRAGIRDGDRLCAVFSSPGSICRTRWHGGHWHWHSACPCLRWHLLTVSPSAPSVQPRPVVPRAASSPW